MSVLRKTPRFTFIPIHKTLGTLLTDKELASLGDAYINFAYSLALSCRIGRPKGEKVKGDTLAQSLRLAGAREHLPSRMTKHSLADAAEALVVYAWLHDAITLGEAVSILERAKDLETGLSQLLKIAMAKLKLS